MANSLSATERAVLEEQLVPAFRSLLGEAPIPTDPAELELLAATLLVPLELPEMPAAVTRAFFDEIEGRGGEDAVGVLAALAALATGDAAVAASATIERLRLAGVSAPVAGRVGTATVRQAGRLDGDGAELLVALLGRPKARRLQVAMLGIEIEDTGGALVECMLSPPMPAAEARTLLEQTGDGSPAEPIEIAALVARAASAAQRSVDLEIALGHDAAVAMPIVWRALTGDPGGLARPATLPPWEDDDAELIVDAAEDEDGYQEVTERLLEELADWAQTTCPPDGPVWRSGDFVGSTMLDWKGGYGDGYLGRWTRRDLAEFLLDWFPRKVSAVEETLGDVVDCVIAFLRFLDHRESLTGEPLEALEEACDELRDEFREATTDPSSWGLAKSVFMHMHNEGVDPEDGAAVEAWMTGFNERPPEERDAIIGGAADRLLAAAGAPVGRGGGSRPKQARKRKRSVRRASATGGAEGRPALSPT